MPSTLKSIEKNDIEVARQKLLEAICSELPDDRHRGREAVRQLLNTLIAARERGLAFERIAEILKQSGVDVAAVTLRRYFFELKTETELAAEAERHTKKVAETRRAIQERFLALHSEHGHALMKQKLSQAAPRFANAFGEEKAEVPAPTGEASVEIASGKRTPQERKVARPASPAAPVPPPPMAAAEPARIQSERAVPETVVEEKLSVVLPTSEKNHRAAPDVQSESARTLAQIEEVSLATDERTELLEDVELRAGDLVYYVSGKPFEGFLAQRDIYRLRTVGRLIAPTKTRTSKDFVKMPVNL